MFSVDWAVLWFPIVASCLGSSTPLKTMISNTFACAFLASASAQDKNSNCTVVYRSRHSCR